jgi:hypothetical protein
MPTWIKTVGIAGSIAAVVGSFGYVMLADKWSSVFVIIALIISLLKQIIAFIAFLTTAIKFLVIFAFIAVFLAVGFLFFRAFSDKRKSKE